VTHQRVAETFRKSRVLLAGDAAHVNNPIGGMGLNGGIQDAVNLSDKLLRIMRDGAPEQPLDL
jgi:3-(3-hydroxy-phenyl)propionate hydroxylase